MSVRWLTHAFEGRRGYRFLCSVCSSVDDRSTAGIAVDVDGDVFQPFADTYVELDDIAWREESECEGCGVRHGGMPSKALLEREVRLNEMEQWAIARGVS